MFLSMLWTINAQVASVTTSELEIKKHGLYFLFPDVFFGTTRYKQPANQKGRTFISFNPSTTFKHSTHDKLYTENN